MPELCCRDGRIVDYEDYGAGPLVVLVHGSPGTARAWARVGELLSARFRIVAPNLAGDGATTVEPAGEPADVAYGASLIEELIAALGPPRVVAAHSYGAVVALSVALRGRAELRSLALFEPVPIPVLAAVGDRDTFAAAKRVFDDYIASFEAGDGQAIRKMVDFWFGAGAFAALPEGPRSYLIEHTADNVHDVRAMFRERYSLGELRALATPVTVVYGGASPDPNARIAAALAASVAHGKLVRLEGATHALTTTHAGEVAALIAELAA
jgi:pimeloyl-ACP methyl ester carboxylesterase